MSFEFAVPFLLSADVFPSCGNSKLTTPTKFGHRQSEDNGR